MTYDLAYPDPEIQHVLTKYFRGSRNVAKEDHLFDPNSLNIIAAPPKSGKTTLSIALAKAIARGESFAGFKMEHAAAGFYNLEESGVEFVRVIDRHHDINNSDPMFIVGGPQRIDSPTFFPCINRFFSTCSSLLNGKCVVFIDSLQALVGKTKLGDAKTARGILEDLKGIAEGKGTIILMHHTDKNGRLAGNIQIEAAASQVIRMSVEQKEDHRLIKWQVNGRSNHGTRDIYIKSYSPTSFMRVASQNTIARDQRDRTSIPVLVALASGPKTIFEICNATHLKYRTVHKCIQRLQEEKQIRSIGGHRGQRFMVIK